MQPFINTVLLKNVECHNQYADTKFVEKDVKQNIPVFNSRLTLLLVEIKEKIHQNVGSFCCILGF